MRIWILLSAGLSVIAARATHASPSFEITQVVTPAFVQAGVEFPLSVYAKNSSKDKADISVRCSDKQGGLLCSGSAAAAPGETVPVRMNASCSKNGLDSLNVDLTARGSKDSKSVVLPVVAKKLYFAWFSTGKPEDKALKYANVLLAHTSETRDYWRERGVTHCVWKGGNNEIASMKSGSEYAAYLLKDVRESGSKGILIDEIGGYDWDLQSHKIAENGIPGLMEFNKKNPDLFLGVWVSGSVRPPLLMAAKNIYRTEGVDLLMMETYVNCFEGAFNTHSRWSYFDQRINMAREFDVLDHCVLTLETNGPAEKPKATASEIEDQIRYVRRTAPEMPGVGFFVFTPDALETNLAADRFCYKYWILPVVTCWDRDMTFSNPDPAAGEIVKIYGTVNNIGGMDAKNIKVAFYDGHPSAGGRLIGKSVVITKLATDEGCPKGARKVSVDWKATSGFHDIYMAIYASREVTVLDGLARKTIGVR